MTGYPPPLYAKMDVSKFRDGRAHFRNRDENFNQTFTTYHYLQSLQWCLHSNPEDSEQTAIITKTRLFKYIVNFTTNKKTFQIKNSIFHISAQNIDCGYSLEPPRRGGSNEYPQSMFLSRNKKIMYTPVNPSFTK